MRTPPSRANAPVRALTATLVVLAVSTILACTTGRTTVPLTQDAALESALVARIGQTEAVPLASLTSFAWDRVAVIPEGTTAASIESIVGERVITGDRYVSSANLFVFADHGRLVRAVMVAADAFVSADAGRWLGAGVRVAADPSRSGILRLVED